MSTERKPSLVCGLACPLALMCLCVFSVLAGEQAPRPEGTSGMDIAKVREMLGGKDFLQMPELVALGTNAVPMYVNILEHSTNETEQARVLSVIERLDLEEGSHLLPSVTRLAASGSRWLRIQALGVCGHLAVADADFEGILPLLQDHDEFLVTAAVRALGNSHSETVAAKLKLLLSKMQDDPQKAAVAKEIRIALAKNAILRVADNKERQTQLLFLIEGRHPANSHGLTASGTVEDWPLRIWAAKRLELEESAVSSELLGNIRKRKEIKQCRELDQELNRLIEKSAGETLR